METLLSLGLDIGTSTTQLVFSRLHITNRAAAWNAPEIVIADKEVLYRSSIHFTPLRSDSVIDADAIREWVDAEYRSAGMERTQIKTGAVIITGEAARKENAAQVLQALSGYAGEFVVATAGADLESVLAARGAGADRYAAVHNCPLIHMDIGGGTSNFAVFDCETLLDTACLNVGGRLVRLTPDRIVTYISPVLKGLCALKPGDLATETALQPLIDLLVGALEAAAGLRPADTIAPQLITNRMPQLPATGAVLSFSGGVGALLERPEQMSPFAFGDIGVLLARGIFRSNLMQHKVRISPDAIRATVIGAGSHSTQLSGSTILFQNVPLPLRDLPMVCLPQAVTQLAPQQMADAIAAHMARMADESGEQPVALAFDGENNPSFERICTLAEGILTGMLPRIRHGAPLVVLTRADMAKALGHALLCRMKPPQRLVCLDGLSPAPGAYLDIAEPIAGGSALPVVIKTLVLSS